ncbi:helix-turn-helix domain-containing protein [Millisia brevis]|uniref:helix-turn-helix domain-containing protein n=1 Tax=Millisia brevis TaxID=264148 RepID=UPI0008319CB2|nr:helix-turn-helix domain-containing protein [Millisia brevis]
MTSLTVRKPADLAAVIRAVREDAGLSQAELADRLAFSRDYMVDLESGKANLYATRLFRVLHELGITLSVDFEDDRADA